MELLQGKKTYLAAGLLVILGAGLILAGQSSLGMVAILQGFGLVGLGDRANRHQSEILDAIQGAGRIAFDLEARNPLALKEDLAAAGKQLMSAEELKRRLTASMPPEAAGWTGGKLPSAADLDVVAAEAKVAAATGNASLPAAGAQAATAGGTAR